MDDITHANYPALSPGNECVLHPDDAYLVTAYIFFYIVYMVNITSS